MSTLTIDEGLDKSTGIVEKTHFEDGDIILEKQFDAQPHLEYAKAARDATDGQRWGEGRHIGHIPPAFYGQLLLIKDPQERDRAVMAFFRENPAFLMFERALK